MGQPISVVEKPSSKPGVVRFQINRSLTGMGHEHYDGPEDAIDDRPADELARRLFGHGGVDHIHVNSNVITVDLEKGSDGGGLAEIIAHLFLFYGDEPEAPEAADDEAGAPAQA